MKKNLYTIIVVIIILSASQYFALHNYNIRALVISDLITFLSILFGFYITSFAIFASSRYVSSLYKVTDKRDKSLTLLHVLLNNYKIGLVLSLATLIYAVAIDFFIKPSAEGYFSLGSHFLVFILPLVIVNFWYCFLMLRDLTNVVLQEGKYLKE